MKRYIIPMLSLAAMPAFAQLDNTVEVTSEVKPVVKDADKINVFPNAIETTVTRPKVTYSQKAQPLSELQPDGVNTFYSSDAATNGNKRGYAHLGGGSHGQVDAKATYKLDLTPDDELNIDLTLAGQNGKVWRNEDVSQCWKDEPVLRMYRNRAATRYDHTFRNDLGVYAKGAFENHVFNYIHSYHLDGVTDKQHNVLGDFSLGMKPYEWGDLKLSAEAGVQFFSQERAKYANENNSETVLKAKANGDYAFTDENHVEMGVEFFRSSYSMEGFAGASHLTLSPHYIYNGNKSRLQLGVVVTTEGDVAPDARLTCHVSPNSDLYFNAIGYVVDNDFRRFTSVHPYFEGSCVKPEFHQIDANVGYRFRNAKGNVSGNVNVGFDKSVESPQIDWMSNAYHGLEYPFINLSDVKRFYINADFTYSYRDRVKVALKNQFNAVKYKHSDRGDKWLNGSFVTPTLDLDWSVDVKIIDHLYAGLTWNMQYYDCPEIDAVPFNPFGERPHTKNLGASLHYSLPVDTPVSFFVKGDNLLNQKYDKYFCYSAIGANVLAGVAVSF